jgi:hypothetical protein
VRTVLGAVIGERQLATGGVRPKRVTVSLGMPRLPRGEQDWECPFRITGAGMRVLECGYGVDAIQAIQTALGGIRYFLEKSGKPFEWFDLPVDVAFPKSIPSYGDERLTKRLETLIDRELKRNLTRLRRRHQRKQARQRPSATSR